MFSVFDRVRQKTNSVGTGSITLDSSLSSFVDFSEVFSDGDRTFYTVENYENFEVGIGTYSGNVLTRDQVLASSNSGQLLSIGLGNNFVFVTYPSSYAAWRDINASIQSNQVVIHGESAGSLSGNQGLVYNDNVGLTVTGYIYPTEGVNLESNVPSNTSNMLYNDGGDLYFNGSLVGSGTGTPSAGGSTSLEVQTISTSTGINTDVDVILINSTGLDINITLPPANNNNGKEIKFKRIGSSGVVSILASGSDAIDGVGSLGVNYIYESISLISNSENWFIF